MNRVTKALADTATKVLFRSSVVTEVVAHGAGFRSIELAGDALAGASWYVGDKVQVQTEPGGFTVRTYTPISWDTARGATRLLTYAHGEGPGSAWVRSIAPGSPCQRFGPRRSLKLDELAGPVLFVGDETSFALAAAWRGRRPDAPPVAELFEVTDAHGAGSALDAVGLASAQLFPRSDGGGHVERLFGALVEVLGARGDAVPVLTGKAQTIAAIRRGLKQAGLADRPVRVKAYWDEHRTGLD